MLITTNQARALGILKGWFIAPMLFSLIFLDTVKTVQVLKKTALALSISAWPVMIYGLAELINGTNMTISGRLDSFFDSPNYVAMLLAPMIILYLGIVMIDITKSRKKTGPLNLSTYYYVIWLAVALVTLFFTKSFGGWFGVITGSLALVIFIPRFTIKKLMLFPIILIGLTGLTFFAHQKSFSHYDNFWQVDSLMMRKQLWINSAKLLVQNPILGIGLADFKQDYHQFVIALPENQRPRTRTRHQLDERDPKNLGAGKGGCQKGIFKILKTRSC